MQDVERYNKSYFYSFAVFFKNAVPILAREAVAKIRYFCVSSIKSLISSENWSSEKTTAKAQKYYLCNKVLFPCVDTLNLFKFWHGGQLIITC